MRTAIRSLRLAYLSFFPAPSVSVLPILVYDCHRSPTFLRTLSPSPRRNQHYVLKPHDGPVTSGEHAPVGYTNGTSFDWNTRGQVIEEATVLPALGLIGAELRLLILNSLPK